ncbi:ABC transporter substrate-binding protein [Streptomyces gamaensis]|uniref:ABC transporter substrate-binding protein n=1 Tax=Streptomyces gamaensis TaxID=1763542 RepID=A0ABW0YRB2_9ACTN
MRGVRARAGATAGALLLAGGAAGCGAVGLGSAETRPVTVGTTDTVTTLDPAGAYDAGSWNLYSNLYQSLLTFAPGSATPVPDAARRCGFHGDELLVYSCELRDGLTFADGHRLTARDVKFSFDRVRRIASPQGPAPLLRNLDGVEASGARVTFRLRTPDATFPFKIATGAGSIVDSARYPADRLRTGQTADGSGPYVLKRYVPGHSAELEPNGRYRGAVEQGGGEVVVRYFPDSGGLSEAWRRHTVEVAARQLRPADIARQKTSDAHVRMVDSPGSEIRSMVFNVREGAPAAPAAVRRAVASLVDREALARDVHLRTVEPLYSIVPQGFTGHATPFYDDCPRPDPERARSLLRQAGIRTPVAFTLAHSRGAAAQEEAALLKQQLESSGLFEVEVRRVEWQEFQQGYAAGAYDAYLIGWLADYPDPDTFAAPLVGKDSSLHTGYSSDRIEELIRATERSPQRGRAAGDFRALQKTVAADVPLLPLWQKKNYVLGDPGISGTQYLSDGTGIWRLWRLGRI